MLWRLSITFGRGAIASTRALSLPATIREDLAPVRDLVGLPLAASSGARRQLSSGRRDLRQPGRFPVEAISRHRQCNHRLFTNKDEGVRVRSSEHNWTATETPLPLHVGCCGGSTTHLVLNPPRRLGSSGQNGAPVESKLKTGRVLSLAARRFSVFENISRGNVGRG